MEQDDKSALKTNHRDNRNQEVNADEAPVTKPIRKVSKAKHFDGDGEQIKLLEYIFDTLCSLRLTAKSYNYGFLSYLIEMSALEVQREIKEARMAVPKRVSVSDKGYAAASMPLKASR